MFFKFPQNLNDINNFLINLLNNNIMNKLTAFISESFIELTEKVSWPKWSQLQQSTMIVLGATVFITAIVALMDFVANGSMKFIYSLFA